MISKRPFLVACGQISNSDMKFGALTLSGVWGGDLKEVSSLESPDKVLNNLKNERGLTLLNGDPGICLSCGGSWIESLGDWRQPIILFVRPCDSGEIPGTASAFVALTRQYSVPLIGIIQLGGHWIINQKSLDKLPWCGWLPDRSDEQTHPEHFQMDSFLVLDNLKKRMFQLGN